jgi:hypothetical protein
VAGSQGIQIYDLTRTLMEKPKTEKGPPEYYSDVPPNCITSVTLPDPNDEVNTIINMVMPFANKQHILCAAT